MIFIVKTLNIVICKVKLKHMILTSFIAHSSHLENIFVCVVNINLFEKIKHILFRKQFFTTIL